jgi:hypothetical protein
VRASARMQRLAGPPCDRAPTLCPLRAPVVICRQVCNRAHAVGRSSAPPVFIAASPRAPTSGQSRATSPRSRLRHSSLSTATPPSGRQTTPPPARPSRSGRPEAAPPVATCSVPSRAPPQVGPCRYQSGVGPVPDELW